MGIGKSSIKIILSLVFCQGLWVPRVYSLRQKTARFYGLWKPSGEMQSSLISANSAIIGRILHMNRKGWIYRLFQKRKGNFGENRSPYWVYFTHLEL